MAVLERRGTNWCLVDSHRYNRPALIHVDPWLIGCAHRKTRLLILPDSPRRFGKNFPSAPARDSFRA